MGQVPTAHEPFRTVADFARAAQERRRISMVTAYDAWSARLIARSNVDAILIGDSVATVVHGDPTTVNATVELMALPFLSYRKDLADAMRAVEALVQSGAHAVRVPTIGIGAGAGTDGQVLVLFDPLGAGPTPPRFVRQYMEAEATLVDALNRLDADVKEARFASAVESYS